MFDLRIGLRTLCLLVGLSAGGLAHANSIQIIDSPIVLGTVKDSPVVLVNSFNGYLAQNSLSGTQATLFTELLDVNGDPVKGSSEENEAGMLNYLAGTSFTTGLKTDTSPGANVTFNIVAEYFMLKVGNGWSFFKNLTGGTLTLNYTQSSGKDGGKGLSHYTQFGVAVPGPIVGAGPVGLVLGAGMLIGWVRRRRRNLA